MLLSGLEMFEYSCAWTENVLSFTEIWIKSTWFDNLIGISEPNHFKIPNQFKVTNQTDDLNLILLDLHSPNQKYIYTTATKIYIWKQHEYK